MPEQPTPPPAERYVLGDELARGATAVVYRATNTVPGREVALKVLQGRFGPDPAAARRIFDEARITACLQHPGIPAVHEAGVLPDGRPFLAMWLIKGRTLDDLIRDAGPDRGRLVAAFEAVCQAVGYAHAHGIAHRDLKPSHVMVGAFGEVQVLDWGRAAVQADPREDVLGLGAILCAILTGRPPDAEATDRLDACGADPGLVALCMWCLSPDPADRPPDAGAVAAAVSRLRADAEVRLRQAERDRAAVDGRTAEQLRRRWRFALVALIAFGCGCVVTWLCMTR